MTPVVQDFLTTFDRPTDSERLELASEILKRTAYLDFSPLSDEDLVLISEGIFSTVNRDDVRSISQSSILVA